MYLFVFIICISLLYAQEYLLFLPVEGSLFVKVCTGWFTVWYTSRILASERIIKYNAESFLLLKTTDPNCRFPMDSCHVLNTVQGNSGFCVVNLTEMLIQFYFYLTRIPQRQKSQLEKRSLFYVTHFLATRNPISLTNAIPIGFKQTRKNFVYKMALYRSQWKNNIWLVTAEV